MMIPVESARATTKVICPRALRSPSLNVTVRPPAESGRPTAQAAAGTDKRPEARMGVGQRGTSGGLHGGAGTPLDEGTNRSVSGAGKLTLSGYEVYGKPCG